MSLKGKTVLVTGAAKRVGSVIARCCAERGANLVLHYNTSRLPVMKLKKELTQLGVHVELFQADLSKIAVLEKKTKLFLKKSKKIDVLINNASSFYPTPFGKVKEKDWDVLMGSNLKGPFFLSQIIGQQMKKRKKGKIVFIGDWSAVRPYTNYIPYSLAKAGVITLTQILAKTLAPYIQVNAVSPGCVMLPKGYSKKNERAIIKKTPLKRLGSPEDIAAGVLFFLEGTDFATGSNLIIDGGQVVR